MSEPILYVNACVRKDSRTAKLAKKLLTRLDKPYEEIVLEGIRMNASHVMQEKGIML